MASVVAYSTIVRFRVCNWSCIDSHEGDSEESDETR